MRSSFRTNVFWSLVLIVAAVLVLRWAVDELMAVLPFLAIGLGLTAAVWLGLAWWRRRHGYY